MNSDSIEVREPGRREELDELADFLGKVFPIGGYDRAVEAFSHAARRGYDWDTSRVALLDGKIVSHCGVFGYTMRVGRARLRAGGVGWVATGAKHRRCGFMRKTFAGALAAMRRNGYDLTLLFGIENVYEKFGYVHAWSDTDYLINVEDLSDIPPLRQYRRFQPRFRTGLAAHYNRGNARATGSSVHAAGATGWFNPFLETAGVSCAGKDGRLAGYALVRPERDTLRVHEAAGRPERLLGLIRAVAQKSSCCNVRICNLSHLSPLARALRRRTCRTETRYRRSGGPMVRTINLASCLGKMCPELSHRLNESPMRRWEGTLMVADPREKVFLHISKGRARVGGQCATRHALGGGEEVAQLLIGTDDPTDIIRRYRMRATGDARPLAATLFPNQYPELSAPDRF